MELLLGDLGQRIETLAGDAQRGADETQRLEQEMRSGRAQLEQWIAERIGQEAVLQGVRARLLQMDQAMQGLQRRLTEAQVAVQGVRATREHRRGDLERLRQEQQDALCRVQALSQQVESLRASIGHCREERRRQEELCRELGQSAEQMRGQLVEAQERQAQGMADAQSVESQLERVRKAIAALRDRRMSIEIRRAEIRTQLSTVESTLNGTYQVDPTWALLPRAHSAEAASVTGEADSPREGAQVQTEDEIRQQLLKIRERLDRMGPINLAAITEHQELEERHRFLSSQEQDLSNSITSLKEIIQRINRTTKDMFAATFEELQEKFGEVFTKFFPGGRAELQLVEWSADDTSEGTGPEEPGVEIVAQPPGKRLKNITMLSGGEKTLTAMALLFASFLIRPTPFCILDEIDAPLDEENIGRFTSVLRELAQDAQFMVITHNKRTMGIADSLFGVTMEEPGISKLVSVRLADLQPV
jgi:chromosome segregation protein